MMMELGTNEEIFRENQMEQQERDQEDQKKEFPRGKGTENFERRIIANSVKCCAELK